MKKVIIGVLCVALIGLATAFTFLKKEAEKSPINWVSFEQALELSKKTKKKVFIDVYTDWCGWCKRMDATTFSNEKIADYVNKKYYAVKLDAESMKTFSYKGKTMSERELAGQIFQVSSYPTTVYLDENFDVLSPVPGYLDVPKFDMIVKYFGEDAYKKQGWQDFEASYKPSN